MKFYHGTTRNRLLSILQQGLLPKIERGSTDIMAVHLTSDFFWSALYANRKKIITRANSEPVVLILEYTGEVEEYTDTLITEYSEVAVLEKAYLSRAQLSRDYIVGFVTVPTLSAWQFLEILQASPNSAPILTYKNKLKDIYR